MLTQLTKLYTSKSSEYYTEEYILEITESYS